MLQTFLASLCSPKEGGLGLAGAALKIMVVTVGHVGAKLPRAHLAAGRPGQDANLLEQSDRGDDTRHFHHKNEVVHFEPLCSFVNLGMKMVS